MKKTIVTLLLILLISLVACTNLPLVAATSTSQPPQPTDVAAQATDIPTEAPTPIPTKVPDLIPTDTPAAQEPPIEGLPVSYGLINLKLPSGLAASITGVDIPRADGEDVPVWGRSPGHIEATLEGYLQGQKFHQPKIYVYLAQDFAELHPGAFESIRRLNNIHGSALSPTAADELPGIPFFNATKIFASNVQTISFTNGWGVRFLTQYAQYFASVNNDELFYNFQGVTSDGQYYVIAIFPITAPLLAETNAPNAAIPIGGVPYPDVNASPAEWNVYYASISSLLDTTDPEAFSPALTQLDGLIRSMAILPGDG